MPQAPPSIVLEPPVAIGVPVHKIAENTPDPFWSAASPVQRPEETTEVHPHPGIFLLYMLVTWLHLQFHLPFRACTAVLNVVAMIIQAFGQTIYLLLSPH